MKYLKIKPSSFDGADVFLCDKYGEEIELIFEKQLLVMLLTKEKIKIIK